MLTGSTPTTNRYAYIDALRGYAILGVMSVHTSQHVPGLGGRLRVLASSGQEGVQLFFVVSAITHLMSWHARSDGTYPFYTRRLFRIAPMFWLAIPFYSLIDGLGARYWAPHGISWLDILATTLFVHGWHPESINSVVPGGWSIAVEMTFYAAFPLLVITLRSWARAAVALVLSILLAGFLDQFAAQALSFMIPDEPQYLINDFIYLWFFNQLPVFIIGFLTFFSLRSFRESNLPKVLLWTGVVLSVVSIVLLPFIAIPGPSQVKYALCFGVLAFCLGKGAGGWLVNPVICRLGTISYSAYLWHFSVLELLSWPLGLADRLMFVFGSDARLLFVAMLLIVACITAGLSTVTYKFVEQPMIAVGSAIARRWRPAAEAAVVASRRLPDQAEVA
jgi:peptidoglycan/LPS O-acetylase OafA/YrhL